MSLTNEIILRPRFKFDVNQDNEALLALFENTKNSQSEFTVSRIDDHVFIRIPKLRQHFWSPQLHLEINKNETTNKATIHGLFGPNPTIWTLFMFLHFIVICLFIGFGIWTYINWSLDKSYTIQLFLTFLMIMVWFAIYFGGRIGKKTGTDQMHELHGFMRDTIRNKTIQKKTTSY